MALANTQSSCNISFKVLSLLVHLLVTLRISTAAVNAIESIENNVHVDSYKASDLPFGKSLEHNESLLKRFPVAPFINQEAQLTATNCFSNYIQHSNKIGQNYSRNYNQCIRWALESRKSLEKQTLEERLTLSNTSKAICERFDTCNGLKDALEAFDCHSKIGAQNSREVYLMSGNASDYVQTLSEEYRFIDRRQEQCGRMAERVYIQSTADNYRQLQHCLENGTRNPVEHSEPTTPSVVPVPPFENRVHNEQNLFDQEEHRAEEAGEAEASDVEMIEGKPVTKSSTNQRNPMPATVTSVLPSAAYRLDDGHNNAEPTGNSTPMTIVTAKTATQKIAKFLNQLLH